MRLTDIKNVYFLGIGGIGMSALARYFKSLGANVSGYDKSESALTGVLQQEGIKIIFEDKLEHYPTDVDLVVYTPAIPSNHIGLNFYKEKKLPLKKRAEVLGIISEGKYTICVAGSHGKTTVSSMIAHIIANAGYSVTAFLGGISTNFNSNYFKQISSQEFKILEKGKKVSEVVVIEADEYDRSFHQLSPNMAVITAVDTDHLDIYGSKEKIDEAFLIFANKIYEEGFLVIKDKQSIQEKLPKVDVAFYDLEENSADVFCSKYWVANNSYVFSISYFGEEYIGNRLNMGGLHNIENAIAAFTIAKELKIPTDKIQAGIASFKGISRRFETIVQTDSVVYVDDYAHHPEEIRMFLKSIQEIYPDKKITAIFQPHLFSRTKDLANEFAAALSTIEEVILLPIYPARELPMEGVTSDLILQKITMNKKKILSKEEVLEFVKANAVEVLVTIGAGDIDKLVNPLKEILLQKNKMSINN